jgi:hypothetical protein
MEFNSAFKGLNFKKDPTLHHYVHLPSAAGKYSDMKKFPAFIKPQGLSPSP